MQTLIKNLITRIRSTSLSFLVLLILTGGCAAPKPMTTPNPLEGWKGGETLYIGAHVDGVIITDYKNYIRGLPAGESHYITDFDIRFFEDGGGRHAVEISIPLNGTWWKHVLIYDKDNNRIRVIKYASGRYAS